MTRQMRDLAVVGEWDGVSSFELKRVQIIESLKSLETTDPLDQATSERKAVLISEILLVDEEIRRQIAATMEALSAAMESNRQAQKAIRAYGP